MPYPPSPRLRPPDPWHVPVPRRGVGIVLRLPRDDDVEAITAACQDPDIQRFALVPSPYTAADARGWVASCARAADDGAGLHLLVCDAATDAVLAAVGVQIDWRDVQGQLGYWAAPAARGQGVVRAAAGALCRHAVEDIGLPRLWLQAAATNPASAAVARALGFTHEGVLRGGGVDGPTGDRGAPRVDMHLWGLLAHELPDRELPDHELPDHELPDDAGR